MLRLMLVTGLAAPEAAAQTYWRVPGGLGGGLVGAGLGYVADVAAWNGGDCSLCGPTLKMTTLGIVGGSLLGFASGLDADRKLARGETLGSGRRKWLRFNTFLAPVGVGSVITFAVVDPPTGNCVWDSTHTYCREPQPAMSDETVAMLGIGGGVALGLVLQYKYAHALWPRGRVGVSPDGRGIQLSYAW